MRACEVQRLENGEGNTVKRMLRLTGGSYGGRRLYVPETGVRPATNRVREAVFSTLLAFFDEGIKGRKVLDLFAGSGSLGIEALSRGAGTVTFVDAKRESIRAIDENLRSLGLSAEVVQSDVRTYLKRKKNMDYDLIFMDPPYRYRDCSSIVSLIKVSTLRRNETILVYERTYEKDPPGFEENALLLKRKKYGQTELLYFRV
jgi:16S rRNA (guanine966-N2)-methyltransferase